MVISPQRYEIARPALLEVSAWACKESFYQFVQYFWETIVDDPYQDNWHIKTLCDELQIVGGWIINREDALYDLLVNVPPGTSKTTIITIMWPAWVWTSAPWAKWLTASYAQELNTRNAVKTRDLLKSDKYQETYPGLIQFKRDMDNKTFYENTRKGSLYASSVGGALTGFHAHGIVVDDPINPKQARSIELRQTARDWLDKTVSTRKVDKKKTPTVMVMQRLAEDDPSGHWLEKKGKNVRHICLPGELTDLNNVKPKELEENYKDGLLDPVRLGRKVLDQLKIDLSDEGFAGQILQSPQAAEGNIFKRAYWQYYEELPAGRPIRITQSWDTAFKAKKKNDYNVCTTWHQYPHGHFLVDFWMEKVEYPELKAQAQLTHAEHKPHAVLVEDKANGTTLIQEMKKGTTMPIVPIVPETDKEARAHACTPTLKAGNVYLPLKKPWTAKIVDHAAAFPAVKNDDIEDSITQYLNWVREQGAGVPRIASGGLRTARRVTQGYGPQ